jgi:hypothetical protein
MSDAYKHWQGLQIRRPDEVPAATPLTWQVEKHTEHNDRMANRDLPADFPYEVQRGDVDDALAVIALRESIRKDIEWGKGLRVREALELGATWTQVAAALDIDTTEARWILRRWVEGQLHLHQGDVAQGRERPLGLDQHAAVETLLFCQLGDDERRPTEEESDEATADAAMPRDPVELEERMTAEQVEDEEKHVQYTLTINAKQVLEGTLQDVRAGVAELVTDRLAEAPERVATDAQTINMAFNTGAVEEQLDTEGDWYTVLDAYGEKPLRIRITKESGSE